MKYDVIGWSVPFFVLAMLVEGWVSYFQGRTVYRFNDTLTNLGSGIGSQVWGLLTTLLAAVAYLWLFRHARLFDLSPGWAWFIGFLGVDFLYYWWHRGSHRVAVLWASHVVHHQSEEYNLSVALRQAWFTNVTGFVFYLPLAVLGVPYEIFLANGALSLVYQFWIHTKLIDRMGWFEWVFNTPSHHRVHHASGPRKYLDKNYAATLIVWDRWFGTFQPEEEEPLYGIIHPLHSWSAPWANVVDWRNLWTQTRRLPRWRDKVQLWFREPGWQPGGVTEESLTRTEPKWEPPPLPIDTRSYVAAQYLSALAAGLGVMYGKDTLPASALLLLAAVVFGALLIMGALLERRRWALSFERARLGALAAAAVVLLASGNASASAVAIPVIAYVLGSGIWIFIWGWKGACPA